jgi:ATP-dependent RNA helicase DeaD
VRELSKTRTCLFRPKEDKNLVTTSDKPAARTTRPRSSSPRPEPVVVAPPAPVLAPPAPPPGEATNGFAEFLLSNEVNRAIREMGFVRPTEIQAQVIPLLLDSRDVIGQAQTGTGKTAAFGIPLIEGIDETLPYPQALVLAPTRELAMQIGVELRKIATHLPDITIATIYGGASYGRQFDDLKAGAQVVVGTPGRVIDHIGRGTLKLDNIDYLVLDEADRMLDMGFLPDVERILRRTPRERQTALFSATVPTVIRILSRRYMHEPAVVHVQPQQVTVDEVEQVYYEVADRDKLEGLISLFEQEPPERAMIFRQTKIGVDRLVGTLKRRGLAVEAIHGDMSQKAREYVLNEFRGGQLKYLVATDVAARGLDIPDVSHVFNYDIPEDAEAYVHRIGRTARAGRSGNAVTFVGEWDADKLPPIQKIVGGLLKRKLLPIYERR